MPNANSGRACPAKGCSRNSTKWRSKPSKCRAAASGPKSWTPASRIVSRSRRAMAEKRRSAMLSVDTRNHLAQDVFGLGVEHARGQAFLDQRLDAPDLRRMGVLVTPQKI